MVIFERAGVSALQSAVMGYEPAGCGLASQGCWQLLRHMCFWHPAVNQDPSLQEYYRMLSSQALACMLGEP